MLRYIIKCFALHLVIITVYLGFTSYEFTTSKYPNPIGVGLLQWVFIFLHFGITTLCFLIIRSNARDREKVSEDMLINLVVIASLVILYGIAGNEIWEKLWSLRPG